MKHLLANHMAALLVALLPLVGVCGDNDDTREQQRVDVERQQGMAEKPVTPGETLTPETKAQIVGEERPVRHHGMGLIPSGEEFWDGVLNFTVGEDGLPTLEKDRQRAAQGDVDSQFNLGLTYEGRGYPEVKQDYAQAIFWYKKAIEKREGEPQSDTQRSAQRNLMRLYEKIAMENNQGSGEKTSEATPIPLLLAPGTKTPERNAPTLATQQEADATFGFQVLGQLDAAEGNEGNLLIGPRNIRTALAAVAVGAVGQTRDEILAQTGEYDSINNASGESFTNALHIWTPAGKKLKQKFIRHFSDARVESTSASKAPRVINAYVAKQTKGKIKEILKDPPSEDGIVLTTVLDFEGKWKKPFPLTRVETFFVTPNERQKMYLMYMTDRFRYNATEDGQMVQLPYQDDGLVMTIFLPKPELSLADWLKQGKGKDWRNAVGAMKYKEGSVNLPRVEFDFEAETKDALKTLGIQSAFTDNAQFDGILQRPVSLKIARVLHKTHIDFDEYGAKAAAVTAVEMLMGSPNAKKEPPFSMRIDRPFFLTIGDAENHKILFMGIVRQPARAE
jgi:serpin B